MSYVRPAASSATITPPPAGPPAAAGPSSRSTSVGGAAVQRHLAHLADREPAEPGDQPLVVREGRPQVGVEATDGEDLETLGHRGDLPRPRRAGNGRGVAGPPARPPPRFKPCPGGE